ncbi:MAG: hypothetical protein HFH68_04450 [Lachnospiraceae bacterium]|nr:hypothetical protein [Lachnospiraceae bacterium]
MGYIQELSMKAMQKELENMTEEDIKKGLCILDKPEKVPRFTWLYGHIGCAALIRNNEGDRGKDDVYIIAYATEEKYNKNLWLLQIQPEYKNTVRLNAVHE